jgi:hypothetical protein
MIRDPPLGTARTTTGDAETLQIPTVTSAVDGLVVAVKVS